MSDAVQQVFAARREGELMTDVAGVLNLVGRAKELSGRYENVVLAAINDHVVRLAVMTEPYFWHVHPDSDELFLGVEGTLVIEVDGRRVELKAGDVFTVPLGVKHRTAPLGARSVNVTVERAAMTTNRTED